MRRLAAFLCIAVVVLTALVPATLFVAVLLVVVAVSLPLAAAPLARDRDHRRAFAPLLAAVSPANLARASLPRR